MGIHNTKHDSIVSMSEVAANVLSTIPRASRDTKVGISIPGSIARKPLVRSLDRAIANLGVGSETIE